MTNDNTPQGIPVETVAQIVGLADSTIFQKVRKGEFPRPIKVGGATRWFKHEVVDWLMARPRMAGKPDCLLATKGNRIGPPRKPRARSATSGQ